MKRRPLIIAAVVTVAAVACVMPWWWEIWLAVAYEEKTAQREQWMYLKKRFSWLPGLDGFIPNQVCPRCRPDSTLYFGHKSCSFILDNNFVSEFRITADYKDIVFINKEVRPTCTCPPVICSGDMYSGDHWMPGFRPKTPSRLARIVSLRRNRRKSSAIAPAVA